MTTIFEIGQTYSTRSICDYDCIFTFKVIARTAKQVTLESNSWGVKKRGIKLWNGVETCSPLGTYSMSPIIRADKAGEIY